MPLKAYLPSVWLLQSGEDLHERGLAGTILARPRMNLTGTYFEMNTVQCLYPGKGLRQVPYF
jgi:hypothetical protein